MDHKSNDSCEDLFFFKYFTLTLVLIYLVEKLKHPGAKILIRSSYPAVTGGMGCPFLLHVTSGEGFPSASHGRTTSVPTSAAILTVLSLLVTPIIFGMAVDALREECIIEV